MKRDWNIIRNILISLEEKSSGKHTLHLSDFPEDEKGEYSYHVELLIEAGMISGSMSKAIGRTPHDFIATRMTWEGHEFLDAIRNDTVWKKAKSSFAQHGLSMTFDLIRSVATDIAIGYLKTNNC